MHLCVIGNSHLAAMKLGWEQIRPQSGNHMVTFFGCAGSGVQGLTLKEGRLVSDLPKVSDSFKITSGGLSEIENIYDAYAVCGLFGTLQMAQIYRNYRTSDLTFGNRHHLLSDFAFETALSEALLALPAIHLPRLVSESFGKPVLLLPRPHLSEEVTSELNLWKRLFGNGDGPLLAGYFLRATQMAAGKFATIIPQPEETTVGGIFTKQIYSTGATRLTKEKEMPESDHSHMNGDYGAAVMRTVLSCLDSMGRTVPESVPTRPAGVA